MLTLETIEHSVRVYAKSAEHVDRFTVVFAQQSIIDGHSMHDYVYMSANPFSPQGLCQHVKAARAIDARFPELLGKRVAFATLPRACQNVVRSML